MGGVGGGPSSQFRVSSISAHVQSQKREQAETDYVAQQFVAFVERRGLPREVLPAQVDLLLQE